ncbi:MAG: hypothetical protein NWE93_07890 [Candidatus Bathyarchaeota archaeon]|nr:hypothetical protein [Candidatus Bathyarchaeota archaeon]
MNEGASLTIQPGVTVNINSYYLRVNGTLNARGTPDNKIVINIDSSGTYYAGIDFTSSCNGWNNQTGTGSIIQYALITSNRTYYPTIEANSASPKIDSNTIKCPSDGGIEFWYDGNTTVTNNYIQGKVLSHCYGGYAIIANNTIVSPSQIALNIGGNAIVANNSLSGSDQGILCHDNGSTHNFTTRITGNLIVNNRIGIRVFQGLNHDDTPNVKFIIQDNTVTKNVRGLLLDSEHTDHQIENGPLIGNNNLFDNSQCNLETSYYTNLNASSNWWGTTNPQAINQTIYDYYDDFNLGTVAFAAFLTAPNMEAPTYIKASAGVGGSIFPNGYIRVDYGSNQCFTIEANSGYQILAVKVNGTSVEADSSCLLLDIRGGTDISPTFAVKTTPTPSPTSSPTPTPTPTQTPTPTPTQAPTQTQTPASTVAPTSTPPPQSKPTPQIDIICRSIALDATYRVDITGSITYNGAPISDAQLFLSYSVNAGNTWVDLTTAVTDNNGEFAESWNLQVTGSYMLKATYAGNAIYGSVSKAVTFAVLACQGSQQNADTANTFSLTSNSTLTSLIFNSTSQELSFSVNGTTGTTGYVSIFIPKTLVSNTSSLKIYLDETPITYTATEQGDSILVTFTYHHSAHKVTIAVGTPATETAEGFNQWIILGVVASLVVLVLAGTLALKRKRAAN